MSGFNKLNLFSSGPAEFHPGPRGSQVARKTDLGMAEGGYLLLGDHTLTVEVRGRLVATDAAGLDALTGAIEAQAGAKADLADDQGHTWSGVTLVQVAYDGPPRVGGVWSIGYTALFAAV